jgi:hypothetical protein
VPDHPEPRGPAPPDGVLPSTALATRKPRRLRRWLVSIGLGLVLLVGTGVVVLRVKFNGDALGDQIETMLNKRMRGRIEIGSIEWPLGALPTVVTGGWVPVTLTGVTVWDRRTDERSKDCFTDDPEGLAPPRRVLHAPHITAELDVHALMFGRHDMVFRNVVIETGHVRLEQIREPYPLHAYDQTSISLVASFYPCMKAGFRAGFYAGSPPPVFDLQDVALHDVDLDIYIGPDDTVAWSAPDGPYYRAVLSIQDVNAEHAFLYMDPTDPLVSRLYFSLAPKTGPATLYMFDTGVKPAAGTAADQIAAAPDEHHPAYSIEMTSIDVTRLAQLPDNWPRTSVANSLRLEGHAVLEEGGTLDLTGDLIDWWDRQFDGQWNIVVAGNHLGPTLKADILPPLGGENVTATLSLTGPFIALPKLDFELGGLRYDVLFADPKLPVLELELDQLKGWVDFVNANGSLDTTIATARCVRGVPDRCGPVPPGGDVPGQVELSASFGLPLNLNANIDITQPLDLGPWLPPIVRDSLGRYLRGRMRAVGKSDVQLSLADIDLALGRSRTERLTRIHSGRIYTANNFTSVELEALKVTAGATAVTVNGGVSFSNDSFGFDVAGQSGDLAAWLRRLRAPALATAADDARVNIDGRWVDGELQLALDGKASLRGVPTVDQVDVVARLEDDLLFIDSLSSPGLGGSLTGSGQIRVSGTPFIEKLDLQGAGLDVKKLPIRGGAVTGTIRAAKLTARGSLAGKRDVFDWLSLASGYATSDDLAVLGDRYQDAAVCINYADDELCRRPGTAIGETQTAACDAAKQGGTCVVARASRADGGALDVTLATPARGKSTRNHPAPAPRLSGVVEVSDAPLEIIGRMLGKIDLPIGGAISAKLDIGGTRAAPTAEGTVALLRAWVLDAFVGDSTLDVAPADDDPRVVVIRGKALHGRLDVVARVGTASPYPIDVTVSGRRIELDPLIDLSALARVSEPLRAWATGSISLHAELGGKAEPVAWVELDELGAVLDHRDPDGRPVPLRLTALRGTGGGKAVSIRATPSSLALVCRQPAGDPVPCPVRIATPAGVLEASGTASRDKLALAAVGTLDLRLIAPLVDLYFDDVSGTAEVSAAVAGTYKAPVPSAEISLHDVRVRPVGQETVVRVPTGLIKLTNGSLGFSDVRIRVDDTYLGEKAELVVKGGIGLEGLTPTKWGVIIEGQVAGKMLLAAAPSLISQASGVAQIDGAVSLQGTGLLPAVVGTISFDPAQPLTVIPRGVRRELAFFGGSLSVDETTASNDRHRAYELEIQDLAGSIDGEGTLRDIDGTLELTDGALTAADITLDADAIPFRIPGTLDLVINADQLHLQRRGVDANWEVSGRKVELVTGRYIRNFDLGQVLRPSPSTGSSKPFWEEYPALGEASIDLPVDVRQFSVSNNIASIEMAGSNLRLSGTPRDPRIDGQIRVQSGSFRLTGTRAKFTRTEGQVLFARQLRVPSDTPTLDIQSEADYRDPSGQDHLITLHISGTIPNLTWDLFTSTGFDKAQTMSLILLGRTPEQLRRSLGDQAIGGDPTRLDSSTAQAGNPLDQVLRDLAGDTISLLVEDSLKDISRLDVARPFATVGSWGFHGEKKLYDNVNVVGDYEQLYRGGRTINIRMELKTMWKPWSTGDTVSVQANYLDKTFEDAAEDDITDLQLKLVYRFFIP